MTHFRSKHTWRRCLVLLFAAILLAAGQAWATEPAAVSSKPIREVLRQPLPPEELTFVERDAEYEIAGPTFTYRVAKATGAIAIRIMRDRQPVVESTSPLNVQIDRYRLDSDRNTFKIGVVSQGKGKIVLSAQGVLRDPEKQGPEVDCVVLHTFFNDGVLVSEVKLTPKTDLLVEKQIVFQTSAKGRFRVFDHKRRDHQGPSAAGGLPKPGGMARFDGPTSCLQVYSPAAGLAIFTDCGATHLSSDKLNSAALEVTGQEGNLTQLALSQYLVHVAAGEKAFLLKGGRTFGFRVGLSVAPNKLPHPRIHDLRMFTWIGDGKHPYPTDEEIATVARMGFTVFQLHRAGTPGDPRPPAADAHRVAKKVQELGMLFLWEENPDLLYANAPGVVKMKAEGRWPLWQGFNYGGRYTDWMDPYCDTVATCLAAPNGLAEYRMDNIRRMMDRMPVDGLYLDDNAAYPTCKLWKEHGHPREVYDCLIEHHELNWRRRELMCSRCPHLMLVSHCSLHGLLPLVCSFDAQLYAEGYTFESLDAYWNKYSSMVMSIPSQGMIWPSAAQPKRCATALAYNFDLLTGGGQYTQIDWRVFYKKYPPAYTKGADDNELSLTKAYNLAQYYFGMYESQPFYYVDPAGPFKTTTLKTYVSAYRNRTWGDWLVPVANMSRETLKTSLEVHSPDRLGVDANTVCVLLDVQHRTAKPVTAAALNEALRDISIPGENLRLYYLRPVQADAPYHLWGGKRLGERWDAKARRLTFTIDGPVGLHETLLIGCGKHGIRQVLIAGKPAPFGYDAAQGIAHGPVTFVDGPVQVEAVFSTDGDNSLPEKPITAIGS
jgi:hypothetical protein